MRRALMLLCVIPTLASAQALPLWSVEAAAGVGPRTARVGDIYYSGAHSAVTQVALDYRLVSWKRSAVYLKGEANPAFMQGDHLDICGIAPNGSCYQDFENNNGVTGALVLRQAIAPFLVLGALAGVGQYNDHVRIVTGAEVMLTDGEHVSLYLSGRYQVWSRQGARYWFAPLTAGIQLF